MLPLNILVNLMIHLSPAPAIIDGYTNRLSAYAGDSIELFLNAEYPTNRYNLKLRDLSGKAIYTWIVPVFPQSRSEGEGFEKGYNYRRTAKIAVPDVPSGIYMWENKIPFVIRSQHPRIVVVYPSNTANAYCNSGGKSLYAYNSTDNQGSNKVSFLRPIPLQFHAEGFLRWMERQHIPDVGYITDADLDDYSNIRKSKLLIIPGHSEYWTLQARKNFDRFVHEGNDAMILSGNTMWWQARYNKTRDQLICYRDAKSDPVKSPRSKTISWANPSLQYPIYPSTGADFSNGGYGLKNDHGWDGYKIITNSPLLEGTSLKKGDVLKCPADELDGAPVSFLKDGTLKINYQLLTFPKVEIIGYDLVSQEGKQGVATWIVWQPGSTSGIIINTASTDWCSQRGIGANEDIRKITATMIRKLLNNENVFSTPGDLTNVAN